MFTKCILNGDSRGTRDMPSTDPSPPFLVRSLILTSATENGITSHMRERERERDEEMEICAMRRQYLKSSAGCLFGRGYLNA